MVCSACLPLALKWKCIRDHHLSHTHHYGDLLKGALQVNLFLLMLNCSAWPCLWVLLNYFLQTILCTSVRNSACGSGRRKKGRREVLFCKETQIYLITDSLSIGPTPSSERDHALRTSTKFLVFSAPSPLVQISLYTRSVPLCHLCQPSIPFIILAHVFIYILRTFPTFHNKYLTSPTLFCPFPIEIKGLFP